MERYTLYIIGFSRELTQFMYGIYDSGSFDLRRWNLGVSVPNYLSLWLGRCTEEHNWLLESRAPLERAFSVTCTSIYRVLPRTVNNVTTCFDYSNAKQENKKKTPKNPIS